jgi:ABC-2 type transport system permease protein
MTLSWKRTMIVARREYLTAVRRKAFLFTLIAVPLYFGGIMAFATRGAMSGRVDSLRAFTRLGVVDSSGLYAGASRTITTSIAVDPTRDPDRLETYTAAVEFYPDRPRLLAALRANQISQGLEIPTDYLASGKLRRYAHAGNLFSSVAATRSIERWLTRNLLARQLDSVRVERATRPSVTMDDYALNKAGRFEIKGDRREMLEFMVPFLFSILLGMCIITGGQYLLQGVTEEKESRILESLLCTLSTEDLLAGKLLGLGAVGVTLVGVWMGAGLFLGGPMMALAGMHLPGGLLAFAFAYFVLGYVFYAGLMTGIGAVTNNMREAQQFAMMFTFANFIPFILMTAIMAKPDGPLAVALSLFPPTAATAMMLRLGTPSADVPPWQIAASLALLALAGWLVLRGAARIFRIGLLMTGKTPNLPEILRWARAGK